MVRDKTVAQLIEKLRQMPQDVPAVVGLGQTALVDHI
jgi:hypothetical protein